MSNCIGRLWAARRTIILVCTPVSLLPLIIIYDSTEARCAYGLGIMAVYWVTEVLPLAATSLLPVVIFPLLGVLPVAEVCKNYIKDTSMFGIGCLTFAIAVETSNLHKRIALFTLLKMGSNPTWLMLGFMLPTWFLSMWVNNTSATAMMIPIVTAVLSQLKDKDTRVKVKDTGEKATGTDVKLSPFFLAGSSSQQITSAKARGSDTEKFSGADRMSSTVAGNRKDQDEDEYEDVNSTAADVTYRRVCKGMSLCVAYAANIGGTGSVSGTSPNLIMQGQAQGLFQKYGLDSGVSFTTWMIFALPGSFISVMLAWMWLSLLYFGPREWVCGSNRRDKVKSALVKETIRRQYQQLGPISFAEKAVAGHFVVLVCLWLSRNPPMVPGWGALFPPKFVGDSAAAILIALSLFIFPAQRPKVFCWRSSQAATASGPVASVLDWKTVQTKYPWGVLLLLGGGFALADVCEESGLSRWIGQQLTVLGHLSPWQLLFVLTIIIATATEVTSNAATASLLLPILGQLAINLGINPLYFLFPCTIATSFAFMLPVATPPNAIVFATGHIEVKDMVLAGLVLNLLCILVVNLAANTWGMAYFHLDTLPPQFRAGALNASSFGPGLSLDNVTHAFASELSTLVATTFNVTVLDL